MPLPTQREVSWSPWRGCTRASPGAAGPPSPGRRRGCRRSRPSRAPSRRAPATLRPCSLAAACASAAKAFGVEVVRRGMLIRSRARLISSASAWARSAAALNSLSRGLAPSRATSASGADLASFFLAPLPFVPVAVAAVGGEGVRAEQRALGDRGGRLGVLDGQGEGGLLGAGQRAGGGCPRRGAAPRRRTPSSFSGAAPRPTASTTGALRPAGGGQLGHLALGTRGAEGLQHGGELAVERLVHGLGAGGDDDALGALGHADDDGVGAQPSRRQSAESQSSHGGEGPVPSGESVCAAGRCCGRAYARRRRKARPIPHRHITGPRQLSPCPGELAFPAGELGGRRRRAARRLSETSSRPAPRARALSASAAEHIAGHPAEPPPAVPQQQFGASAEAEQRREPGVQRAVRAEARRPAPAHPAATSAAHSSAAAHRDRARDRRAQSLRPGRPAPRRGRRG